MADKLKQQYRGLLKEKELMVVESKRLRHDYDLYVKQNDQVCTIILA
jgi:hypothetical protein